MTSRLGARNGSGRRRTASTTEKIAVFAPIPSARVSTATAANTGDLRRERKAYRTSWEIPFMIPSLFPQGRHGRGLRGPASRQEARERGDGDHQPDRRRDRRGVVRAHLEEEAREEPR